MADRMRRVNESVRQVLAEALPELKDPRIGLVTVTGVDTTPDLRHATVYVSVLGSARRRKAVAIETPCAATKMNAPRTWRRTIHSYMPAIVGWLSRARLAIIG